MADRTISQRPRSSMWCVAALFHFQLEISRSKLKPHNHKVRTTLCRAAVHPACRQRRDTCQHTSDFPTTLSDKTLRMDATPLRLGTSPFSWTCGRRWSLREASRGSGVQRPAPHHSERVPSPLKPHAHSSPHFLSTMRAAAHTRHSGNAAHAKTRPRMHVRAAGALSCEAVCGATGERVLATPVSRRPLE
jgi:hypothetical protein